MKDFDVVGARFCLMLALKKLEDGDLAMAIDRAEESVQLLRDLQVKNLKEGEGNECED